MDLYKRAMYESFFNELALIQDNLHKIALDVGTAPTMMPGATAPAKPSAKAANPQAGSPGITSRVRGRIDDLSKIWTQKGAPLGMSYAPVGTLEHAVAGAKDLTQKGGLGRSIKGFGSVMENEGLRRALTRSNLGALGTVGAVGALGLGTLGLGAHVINKMRNRNAQIPADV